MKQIFFLFFRRQFPGACRLPWTPGIMLFLAFATGCGGGSSQSTGTTTNSSTVVTVLTSSTANDQLSRFNVTLNSLTLTTQSGKTATLVNTPLYAEFIHVNGTMEPLAVASIPQDVYTSATASFGPTSFTCQTLAPDGGTDTSIFAYETIPSSDVTMTLPSPITITGAGMGLLLDMLVSQSVTYPSNCYTTGIEPYSITPSFSVSPVDFSGQSASLGSEKLNGLQGIVASIKGNSYFVTSADGSNYGGVNRSSSVDPADGPVWQIAFNSATTFQGIAGSSQLALGMAVNFDGTIQPDGTLLATRIAAPDTSATDTSLWNGPLVKVNNDEPVASVLARLQVGPVLAGNSVQVNFGNSTFSILGGLANLANLPFQGRFGAANMIAGQNVEVTFHATGGDGGDLSASAIALAPQTINGTVTGISSGGGFTVYTVTLAPYDLFPTLAIQQGQTTLLQKPDTVVVYADSSAMIFSSTPVAVGSVLRFYGLVFNDNGTLRMDCAQINDGVAE